MWQYNYTNELYHYGVPGMKWGKRKARLETKVGKKFKKSGTYQGYADHYRNKGTEAYKKHDSAATAFEKSARRLDASGAHLRAEAARKTAAAIRSRGENIMKQQESYAAKYQAKADKLAEKASKYATKKNIDLGKKRIDSILKESRERGAQTIARNEQYQKEKNIRDNYGDSGLNVYRTATGRN